VIAEAAACGRAVVASGGGGALELVTGLERSALVADPGDVRALSAQIARLVRSRELRDRLGAAGRRRALVDFDRRRLAGELAPLYAQVSRAWRV
jgi:glycosyltransferase involved in cell wall biosynthesis